MTNYSQKYFGNQYQSGQMVSKAKGLSKGVGKGFKWLRRGIVPIISIILMLII